MSKRKRVCIRRLLLLAALLMGMVSAWRAGAWIVENVLHGWDELPQLAVTLCFTGAMTLAAEWLAGHEEGI